MTSLIPCVSCLRHVRASEQHCPFCAAPLLLHSSPLAVGRPRATAGLKRAALLALSTSMVAGACGGDDEGSGAAQQGASSARPTSSAAGSAPQNTSAVQSSSPQASSLPSAQSTSLPTSVVALYGAIPAPVDQEVDEQVAPVQGELDGAGGAAAVQDLQDAGVDASAPGQDAAGPIETEDFPQIQPLYGAVPAPQE